MLIDWFTVIAQAINFIILVWLMKRFLYKPILNAIDAREQRIAAELASADQKQVEAQKEHEDFQHKNEQFDQQRAALLAKATDEVQTERLRLLDEARQAAAKLRAELQQATKDEEEHLHQALRQRTRHEVFAIARKTLNDLAAVSLDERLVEVFIRHLYEMDDPTKASLAATLKSASELALVRSAFDLSDEQRGALQNAINLTFSLDARLHFETAPGLIGGIELSTNGQKLAWSIADYLISLEKDVDALLERQDIPEPEAV